MKERIDGRLRVAHQFIVFSSPVIIAENLLFVYKNDSGKHFSDHDVRP